MDHTNEKFSIKNMLFTKAVPNYVVAIPTNGHKLYACTDCGDKFILESSYEHHINRKSVIITYNCRHCSLCLTFYNRCNLLCHIRSHSFKTATINVVDLKVEPLPISFFNISALPASNDSVTSNLPQTEANQRRHKNKNVCFECKKEINSTGTVYKDRAIHYMEYTNEVHSCPVCLFALPTICGLKAHMRLHLKCPPYYCPECGVFLSNKSMFYPYNHDCEGFKMMRATARLRCPITACHILHPTELKEHFKHNHLKKVFKCPFCFVACFTDSVMEKHLKSHKTDGKALIFYQCEMCPGRLVLHNQMDNHLKGHVSSTVYPCWACGTVLTNIHSLIEHHINYHGLKADMFKNSFGMLLKVPEPSPKKPTKPKRIYRVVKRCDQCKRSFIYKCMFDQIKVLPNECPYNCSSSTGPGAEPTSETNESTQIICHMCKSKISENWEDIKKHYASHHKRHQCVDVKVILTKIDLEKFIIKKGKTKGLRIKIKKNVSNAQRKRQAVEENISVAAGSVDSVSTFSTSSNGQFACNKCGHENESKEHLEEHLLSHRDPCTAYQCMECGQCFVVKPSFATHLLLEHSISDVQEYISKKQCYNANALMKYQNSPCTNEPLRENQCRICREQFDNSDDLEKHFRVHGMAFLMKNNSNKNNSP